MEEPQQNKYMNENPENLLPYFNPFEIVLQWLAMYGWWVLGASIPLLWLYCKLTISLDQWKSSRIDAEHHKNPDLQLKRMEAVEAARMRQQQKLEAAAKEYKIKEEERLAKKMQEYIERNEGKGGGNRLGTKIDYLPLCGAGPSGGYKPPKKSKCSGGGCGR